jgi:hypothetical protein
MDPAELTAFLSPFLPTLMQSLADQTGTAAFEHARRLWERLRPKVAESPAAEQAAERVAQAPEDARWRTALELQLEELLAENPELAKELAALWAQAEAAGAVSIVVGTRGVGVGGNVSGSTINTGDNASIGG